MRKSQRIELFREIKHSIYRYLSILFIVALGVAFYMGICSAEPDMRASADALFDESDWMDVRVVSTLGLTKEDVDEVRMLKGVQTAEGAYSADFLVQKNEEEYVVQTYSLCEGLNKMRVANGRLPTTPTECFMDELFARDMGYDVGDTVTLYSGNDDPLSDTLAGDTYTIVGYGSDCQYLTWHRGSSKIGKGYADAFLVLPKEAYQMDVYTALYATVEGAKEEACYGDAYEEVVDAVTNQIDSIKKSRQTIRYQSIIDEATEKLEDAKKEIKEGEDELADAGKELSKAEEELGDGEKKLKKGEKEWADSNQTIKEGEEQIADAKKELSTREKELKKGKKQLKSAKKELVANEAKVKDGLKQYDKGFKEYQQGKRQLDEGLLAYEKEKEFFQQSLSQKDVLNTQLGYQNSLAYFQTLRQKQEGGLSLNQEEQGALALLGRILPEVQKATSGMENPPDALLQGTVSTIFSAWGESLESNGKLLATTKEQLDSANKRLAASKKELDSATMQIENAKKAIAKNEKELANGEKKLKAAQKTVLMKEKELEDGKKKLADGRKKLEDARKDLKEGRGELDDAQAKYKKEKKKADKKLADAKEKVEEGEDELNDLKEPEWFVLDRNSVQNYVEYDMDAGKIGAIGKVFPVLFFLVAALVSLTTMTRMVEENRTQIGTLKALGYGKLSISMKYTLYALTASLLGGLLGMLVGSLYLPLVIMKAYGMLYETLTVYHTPIHRNLTLISLSVAVFCTVFATLAACYKELLSTPALLMRPIPPKQGKRVFLERLPFLWNHLNFTKKATLRNLIRYKKRFFMTVFGIGGCMALLLVGYGVRDSISEIADKQYSELWTYDAVVSIDSEKITDQEAFAVSITERREITDVLYTSQQSMDFTKDGIEKDGTLFVPQDLSSLERFLHLKCRTRNETYPLTDGGVVVTEKLASLLGLRVGDTFTVKEDDAKRYEVKVTAIVENYIRHYVYMSPELYGKVFGQTPDYDQLLLHLEEDVDSDGFTNDLLQDDAVHSVLMVSELRRDVSGMMESLDMVIWVLIVSAGLLAFVVLFNLNNINITERKRELATIKVLGFFDWELAEYVYRENLILTLFGVVAGILMGVPLHQFVIRTCEIDMMMFCREIKTPSYLYSAALTLVFSLVVNAGMYFKFRKIDMVESLKSVE